MQIGVITVNGRQIGTVTQSEGAPDTTPPLVSGADIAGAYDGPENYSLAPQGAQRRQGGGRRRPEGGHHEGHQQRPDHRHGPGHYPRGEEREKEQRQKKQEQREREKPAGNIPYSSSGNPFDRARFAKELEEKPWLKEKMAHIALGENQDPNANLAVIETMMNRAVVRGTSLEQQAKRHRSSGKDEGGYYAGWAPHYSDQKKAMFDRNLGEALKGSNITNYATDNASGDFARGRIAAGMYKPHTKINGEYFLSPGNAEPAHRDRWQRLNRQAAEHEKSKTAETAAAPAKPFDPETMAP